MLLAAPRSFRVCMDEPQIAIQPDGEPADEVRQPGASTSSARAMVWSTLSWVRDLVFSVLVAVVLIVFIYQPVKVEGTSMEPALTDQERIFINKFTYSFGLGNISRGDTVVFEYPNDPAIPQHPASRSTTVVEGIRSSRDLVAGSKPMDF